MAVARRAAALLLAVALALAGALAPSPARAHPMPESRVWIDTRPGGLVLTLQIPLNRLELAFRRTLAEAPGDVLALHGEALSRYLLEHVGARSGSQGWQALRPRLEVVGEAPSAELQATIEMRAPNAAAAREFELFYDAVTHEVRTHRVLVFMRTDWDGGFAVEPPLLLGELHATRNALRVALHGERVGSSFARLFVAGARHIAEGADHLLFLLMLLFVAPLSVSAGRWAAVRPAGNTLRQTAVIVTAFTVGHAATLALGSSGLLTLPQQPVEVAVALSIVVVSVHALRPLFRCGEVVLALAFGLIHGMAFSASLSGVGLTAWQHAQALLAFNLGIEALQLALVLLAMPLLMWLAGSRPDAFAQVRRGAALASIAVSGLWVVQRAGVIPDFW
jgi:hypothetical protein